MPERKTRPSKKPGADWMAWSLHLIFGGLIGAGLGIYVVARVLRGGLIDGEGLIWAVTGSALIVGAASSHWGDGLWMRRSVFSGDEPPRSAASALASIIIAGVGLLAVGYALLSHEPDMSVKVVTPSDRHPHPVEFGVLIAMAMLLAWAWKAGTVLLPWFTWDQLWITIDREEHPGLFWFIWGSGMALLALITLKIFT